MKKSAKQPPNAPLSGESLLDGALGTLQIALTALRSEIEKIADGRAKENGHDAGSRIAFLGARVGTIVDSIRKVEAARAKRGGTITKTLVMAWFRALERAERDGFLRELELIATRKSGLA